MSFADAAAIVNKSKEFNDKQIGLALRSDLYAIPSDPKPMFNAMNAIPVNCEMSVNVTQQAGTVVRQFFFQLNLQKTHTSGNTSTADV